MEESRLILDLLVRKTRAGKFSSCRDVLVLKCSVFKCFPCTLKRKAAFSNFSSVAGSLRAEELSGNIDHHCRNRLKKNCYVNGNFQIFKFSICKILKFSLQIDDIIIKNYCLTVHTCTVYAYRRKSVSLLFLIRELR